MVVPLSHSKTLFVTQDGVPMRFYVRPGPQKRQLAPLIAHGGGVMCRIQEPGAFLMADPSEGARGPGYISTAYIYACVNKNRSLSPRAYRLLPRTHREGPTAKATKSREGPAENNRRDLGENAVVAQQSSEEGMEDTGSITTGAPGDKGSYDTKISTFRTLASEDGEDPQILTSPSTSRDVSGDKGHSKNRGGLAISHGTSPGVISPNRSSNNMDTQQVLLEDHSKPVIPDHSIATLVLGVPHFTEANAPEGENNPRMLAFPCTPINLSCKEVTGEHKEDPKSITGLGSSNNTCLVGPYGKDEAQRQPRVPRKRPTKLVLHKNQNTPVTPDPRTSTPAPGVPYFGKDSEADIGCDSAMMSDEGTLSTFKRKLRDRKRLSDGEDYQSPTAKQKRAEDQLTVCLPEGKVQAVIQDRSKSREQEIIMGEKQEAVLESITGGKQVTIQEMSMSGEQAVLHERSTGEEQAVLHEGTIGGEQVVLLELGSGGEQVGLHEMSTGKEQVALHEGTMGGEQAVLLESGTGGESVGLHERSTGRKRAVMRERTMDGEQGVVHERATHVEQGAVNETAVGGGQETLNEWAVDKSTGEEQSVVNEEQGPVANRTIQSEKAGLNECPKNESQTSYKQPSAETQMDNEKSHGFGHKRQAADAQESELARGAAQGPVVQNMETQQVRLVMFPQCPNTPSVLSQGRMAFTREEDTFILIYVRDHISSTKSATGNRLWKDLEKTQVLRRTWQAMKARYVKYLANHKHKYKLPPKSLPLPNKNYSREETADHARNNSTVRRCSTFSTGTPQERASADCTNTLQRGSMPYHTSPDFPQGNISTQRVDIVGIPQRSPKQQNSASADLPPKNNASHDGASADSSQRSNKQQKNASSDTSQGNDVTQNGILADAPQKRDVLQQEVFFDASQGNDAAQNGISADAPQIRNLLQQEASVDTSQGTDANQNGISADVPQRRNVLQQEVLVDTSQGNNATVHSVSAGTPKRSKQQNGVPSDTPQRSNVLQRGTSADTPQRNNGAFSCTPQRSNGLQLGASFDTPQGSNNPTHGASTTSKHGKSNATECSASSTSCARSCDSSDDSSSIKGKPMLSAQHPANTVQLDREESNGSEDLHIFEIANMEFEVETSSGLPAAAVTPHEVPVGTNNRSYVDETPLSPEACECDSEGLREAISDMMREFQLDVYCVTQALYFNSGEVGSTRHFLRSGQRPDRYPIWDPEDDSHLHKDDPNMRLRLIEKYGADNVAIRAAFLAS